MNSEIKTHKQEFIKTLKFLCRHSSTSRIFGDWLEISSITMSQFNYHAGLLPKGDAFHQGEKKYLELTRDYSRDQLDQFGEMLGLLVAAHELSTGMDFLGEVAGEMEALNKYCGQYFTPYPLALLTAHMSVGSAGELIQKRLDSGQPSKVSILEPASGSGAMCIAASECVEAQGYDASTWLHFDCTDVSRSAFNMTYLQLAARGLQAVVRHGNTLSQEIWEVRETPGLQLFKHRIQAQSEAQNQIKKFQSCQELIQAS